MRALVLSLLLLLTASCTPCGYRYRIEGAQEFVLDSYRIKEGKFSILEFSGEPICCLTKEALQEYQDRIDEDDVLQIALFHPSRKDLSDAVASVSGSVGYRVQEGKIHLPGIPPTSIKGLTLDQAREKLENAYGQEISNIEIFVEYLARNHSKVELLGAVRTPNVPVNGRIRLYEVLSLAGIAPDANLFKSYIIRDGQCLPIDFFKLVHEGDMCQNIVMRPRDKIYIASPLEATVMMLGEVGVPRVIPVPKGSISLREAIASSGGIPFTGDKRCIQVIRGNIACPKIYLLSWNHITYLPNDSLLLMPGDTIYVSETPITRWNRFIDQLLPSSLLIDLGVKTSRLFN